MSSYVITDACIGCTLCAKSCPVNAISGELKANHTIDPERCIRCGLCGRLCAAGAILNEKGEPVSRLAKTDWLRPFVDRDQCTGCSLCVEVCPQSVMAITSPEYHGDTSTHAKLMDPEACIGCGLCAKACPLDAVSMVSRSEKQPPEKGSKGKSMGLYTLYCRIFQFGFMIGNYFMPYHLPKYAEGPGSVRELPRMVKEHGVDNALLVAGPHITGNGLNKGLMEELEKQGIRYTLFTDVGANPTSDMVEEGVKCYTENGCKAIIAFGGGSPMDCAKAIGARIARPRKSVAKLQGLLTVMKKIPPLFVVPTTAGTGSETTMAAVITDSETHHKASINDVNLIPGYAVLDPELTAGLSPEISATTGMDALCHAVEAFTNKKYNTRLENDMARKAVKLIHDNILKVYENGADLEARLNMQRAALFAGRAFTRGSVGYVHAVGHTVSGLHNVSHSLAMAVILPHVMRQFGEAVYDRLAILAEDCGMDGTTKEEKAKRFIRWIEETNHAMGIPAGLNMIEDHDIPRMIQFAMKEGNPLYPVPVVWDKEMFHRLIVTVQRAGRPVEC